MNVREFVKNAGQTLRSLSVRYAKQCWAIGWKAGKTNDLNNPSNPFVGGPQDLIAKGITEVTGPDGKTVTITKLTRLRVRQLSDASLAVIGAAFGKDLVAIKASNPDKMAGKDVVHQEYVETFEENVANDVKHLLNNFVSASAVVDSFLSFICGPETTVEEACEAIRGILNGTGPTEIAVRMAMANRCSWLGRACQDGSWETSGDFTYYFDLAANTAAIDEYVVKPVLTYLLADLENSFNS